MNKPDWKDAPEWAQWLARDADGEWYWYEKQPILVSGWYVQQMGSRWTFAGFSVPTTLEFRP